MKAKIAAAEFQQFDQKATDIIVEKVFLAGFSNRIKLAKLASEETRMGVWQDKVIKNVVATQLVYDDIKNEKTVGIIKEDLTTGIIENKDNYIVASGELDLCCRITHIPKSVFNI